MCQVKIANLFHRMTPLFTACHLMLMSWKKTSQDILYSSRKLIHESNTAELSFIWGMNQCHLELQNVIIYTIMKIWEMFYSLEGTLQPKQCIFSSQTDLGWLCHSLHPIKRGIIHRKLICTISFLLNVFATHLLQVFY